LFKLLERDGLGAATAAFTKTPFAQTAHNVSIEEIADFLCRTPSEIRGRIMEIAEADAIGDPSLLRNGLIDRDSTALETYRDARAALALIREAVEDCAPPGSVVREDYLAPEFTIHAEALVRGIYAIAERAEARARGHWLTAPTMRHGDQAKRRTDRHATARAGQHHRE
jgi:hypothetical protein